MAGRLLCFLLLTLQMMNWVCGRTRRSPDFTVHPLGSTPEPSQPSLDPKKVSSKEKIGVGSRPPRCENKCYGCVPCEAVQVPTTSSIIDQHLHQYTNYEPEGWRCKCGPSFYTP